LFYGLECPICEISRELVLPSALCEGQASWLEEGLMDQEEQRRGIAVPIEWHIPDDIQARYATNLVVQHLEHEFVISFFEIKPPILLGDPKEIAEKAQAVKSIKAKCIAQIIVAEERMPDFIRTMQDNLRHFKEEASDAEEVK
jgi:hypothetical protein